MVVENLVSDENIRLTVLKVYSTEPGWLWVGSTNSTGSSLGAAGELLVNPDDKLREAQCIAIASRVKDSKNDKATIQTSIQVKTSGGDGEMLINGTFQSGGTATHTKSLNIKLSEFFDISPATGEYPLETPLEIGRIEGQPVLLKVGKKDN